jgi:hypothetical protein
MIPSGPVAELVPTAIVSWALGLLMHWWPRLGPPARRRAALASNAAGVGFLIAAVRAEGLRETAITSLVILGPASHTAIASASASLYYYVLTGACLVLGFTGLVAGEPLSSWLRPRPLASSVAVAWLVTLVRFLLEKGAAPLLLAESLSVTWMAPVAGAYLASGLGGLRGNLRPVLRTLVAYAFLVRGFVALVGAVATLNGLGTHYDASAITTVSLAPTGTSWAFAPGSLPQVFWLTLLPQLVLWPALTVLAALAGALAGGFAVSPPTLRRGAPAAGG